MFQSICIKPQQQLFPTDIGLIAENLLYYEQVVLIADSQTLPILINNCDIGILQELITRKNLKICVRENMLAVMSMQTDRGFKVNDVNLITSPRLKTEQILYDSFLKTSGRNGYSRRNTQKLIPYVEPILYDNEICNMVREDLSESSFIKSFICDRIKFYNPEIEINPSQIQYEWQKVENGYVFNSNLDYEEINKHIPNNPTNKLINPEGLILNILDTRGDLQLASTFNADIATTALNTSLMKLKFKDIYEKTSKNIDEIYQFNDFILSDGYAIREAINSGERDFKQFIEILDKADKFKEWIHNIETDKSVIKEYHHAVTKETWIDKLPPKAFRWSFFTGSGMALDAFLTGGIGTIIGLGLSAGDAFLLDKIIKGWKPNSFVEGVLKPFTKN